MRHAAPAVPERGRPFRDTLTAPPQFTDQIAMRLQFGAKRSLTERFEDNLVCRFHMDGSRAPHCVVPIGVQ